MNYLLFGLDFILLFDSHVKIICIFILFPDVFLNLGFNFYVKYRIVDAVAYFLFSVLTVNMEGLIFARFW